MGSPPGLAPLLGDRDLKYTDTVNNKSLPTRNYIARSIHTGGY